MNTILPELVLKSIVSSAGSALPSPSSVTDVVAFCHIEGVSVVTSGAVGLAKAIPPAGKLMLELLA